MKVIFLFESGIIIVVVVSVLVFNFVNVLGVWIGGMILSGIGFYFWLFVGGVFMIVCGFVFFIFVYLFEKKSGYEY